MDKEAYLLSLIELKKLSDEEIKKEVEKRTAIYKKWKDVYWVEFIPMAHGMRLFGEVYNDIMKPDDPYEFMNLLSGSDMIALKRNSLLKEMASIVKKDKNLYKNLKKGKIKDLPLEFSRNLKEFIYKFLYIRRNT